MMASLVLASCIAVNLVGVGHRQDKFINSWWEHGWPLTWAVRWGVVRDENGVVTRTSQLPISFSGQYQVFPLAMLIDLGIACVFVLFTAWHRRASEARWKLSLTHFFAASTFIAIVVHLSLQFRIVIVRGNYLRSTIIIVALLGVAYGGCRSVQFLFQQFSRNRASGK
jgi:hypothetical protein